MKLNHLIVSRCWMDFLESTATGLQLNLTLWSRTEPTLRVQVPEVCPDCKRVFPPLTEKEVAVSKPFDSQAPAPPREKRKSPPQTSEPAVSLRVGDGLFIIARECPCKTDKGLPPLPQRAKVAQKLLSAFLTTLSEEVAGSHAELEFLALRQMNQILLSLFRGDSGAARRALDLILSALIIMLDAEASWLEYCDETGEQRIFKGEPETIAAHFRSKVPGDILKIEVGGANTKGYLSLLRPGDPQLAASLMPLMAQECSIVFEVEHLFRLMKSQLSRLLGALNCTVILVNQHLQITYLNQTAETLLGQSSFSLIGASAEVLPEFWRLLPLARGEAASAEIEISCSLEPVPQVMTDSGQLIQILLNLVYNTIESAGPGGRIELQLWSEEDWAILEVSDDGPGIKAEIFEKLFQPFVTTKERGNGLGLAIAKAIINNQFKGFAIFRQSLLVTNGINPP